MPMDTGEAAPRLRAGVRAAIWLAYKMKVPALAARAPLGLTKLATGMGEARIWRMMARMEESRPPGVSSSMTANVEPFSTACCKPRVMKSEVAGLMMPSTCKTVTLGACALAFTADWAKEASKPSNKMHVNNPARVLFLLASCCLLHLCKPCTKDTCPLQDTISV